MLPVNMGDREIARHSLAYEIPEIGNRAVDYIKKIVPACPPEPWRRRVTIFYVKIFSRFATLVFMTSRKSDWGGRLPQGANTTLLTPNSSSLVAISGSGSPSQPPAPASPSRKRPERLSRARRRASCRTMS